MGVSGGDDERHADAHVEDLIHLSRIDFAVFLDDLENGRNFPALGFNDGVAVLGEDAREVVHQTPAGDMGDAFDELLRQGGQERLVIAVDAQEFLANRLGEARELGVHLEPHGLEKDFTGEGVAVGVESVGRKADDYVAGFDAAAVDHFFAVYHADDGAC